MKRLNCFVFAAAVVVLSGSQAFADPISPSNRQILLQKTQYLMRVIHANLTVLADYQVDGLNQRLDDILASLPGVPQGPSNPPLPVLNSCQILAAGVMNGTYYNFRVQVGENMLAGVSSLSALVDKLHELEAAGICAPRPAPLTLETGGVLNGTYYNFRIKAGNLELLGVSSLNDAIAQINVLRQAGIVSNEAPQLRGEIKGAGVLNGTYYNNLIAIGGQVLLGASTLEQAIAVLNQLRQARLCL